MTAEAAFSEAVNGVAPIAIRTAATLRLADHIAAGHRNLTELAARAEVHPQLLRRLMRFLVVRGVFEESESDTYELTPLSVTLLNGHPSRLRAWLDQTGIGGRMDTAIRSLTDALRTGQAPYPQLHGTDFYTDLSTPRPGMPTFDLLRQAHAEGFAEELCDSHPWEHIKHVVDVGGGTGALVEALMQRFDHLHTTLVDLDAAVSSASRRIAAAGFAGRFTPAPGSFFDPLPPDADTYTFVNVLHNWDDEHATRILSQCAQASGDRGTILMVERLVDEADPHAITAMDLRMFLLLGGQERTMSQFRTTAHRAGLTVTSHTGTPSGLDVIALRRDEVQ